MDNKEKSPFIGFSMSRKHCVQLEAVIKTGLNRVIIMMLESPRESFSKPHIRVNSHTLLFSKQPKYDII